MTLQGAALIEFALNVIVVKLKVRDNTKVPFIRTPVTFGEVAARLPS